MEAIDITFDAAKTRLAAFQLEGESQVWGDWVKTSRDLEAMTWAEFHGLFMSKYLPATARHAKAQEFLELRHETMTVMEYWPNSLSWHVMVMTMWPQIWPRSRDLKKG